MSKYGILLFGSDKMINYILYNPLAGNGKGEKCIDSISIPDGKSVFIDMTQNLDYKSLFSKIQGEDRLIVCGGDGTLNRFINEVYDFKIEIPIYYYAAGSGNDFLNDLNLKPSKTPIQINDYIKNLPTVSVNGKTYRFINGIGYGIDGYCCEERDKKHKKTGKTVNYTLIALKGLLYAFKPRKAFVTVDGKEYTYDRVWMAPAMFGRFFGGGMMVAPMQNRKNKENSVTLIVAHNLSKLKIITLFITIFKGKHIKFKKNVAVHTGADITVRFDKPSPLQIDGETVLDVPYYNVTSNI